MTQNDFMLGLSHEESCCVRVVYHDVIISPILKII